MPDRRIVDFPLDVDHPNFLQGLDYLCQLGLANDVWIRHLGRSTLSCPLPEPQVETNSITGVVEEQEEVVLTRQKLPEMPTVVARFFEELSVRWLLFLGVFLVVLSSGVLVASQWNAFPAVGQYLVLWGYTIIFGWLGLSTGKQSDLKLTSQTLQTIALLLVPLNFWAVDQLNVWQSAWQSCVAIAAVLGLLVGISRIAQKQSWPKLIFAAFAGIGLLQWGWSQFLMPVVAVYFAIGIIIAILWGIPIFINRAPPPKISERNGFAFILFGLGLLLLRAIAFMSVPVGELGLAIGLLGWLLTTLEPEQSEDASVKTAEAIARPREAGGATLFVLSWLATVGQYPWQVLGVSALAIAWLIRKLQRDWLVADLVTLFVVGLQGGILCRDVIPTGLRSSVTTTAVEFSQAQDFPFSVYGITLLPYLLIWAIAAVWFYRTGKIEFAKKSEYLILGLGGMLAVLSLPNPTWRAINFTLTTGIWFYFTHYSRPYLRQRYLYLTHGIGLLAVAGLVERFVPDLDILGWGILCVVGVAAEWTFYLLPLQKPSHKRWQQSSWQFGLALALISYICLALTAYWNLVLYRLSWGIVPCFLTAIALQTKDRKQRRRVVTLSSYSLAIWVLGFCAIDFLSWFRSVNLNYFYQCSSAIATGLMIVNVRLMPLRRRAHLSIVFGTIFVWNLLGNIVPSIFDYWFVFFAANSGVFWGMATLCKYRRAYVVRLYRRVLNQWGYLFAVITSVFLIWASFGQWSQYWRGNPFLDILLASGLLLVVLMLRYWHEPTNRGFILGGIAIETFFAEAVLPIGADHFLMTVALCNLVIATFFWGLQRWFVNLENQRVWRAYPLIFTIIGLSWRLEIFTAFTGCLTLMAGCLFLAIAHSIYQQRVFRFLGFGVITAGIYELVIYQMLQSPGDNLGNGLTVLAVVAVLLALIYRGLYAVGVTRKLTNFRSLPLTEFLIVAHLHWAIAAAFKLATLPYVLPTPPTFRILAIAVNICLALYAFIQANTAQSPDENPSKWSEWWIYVGAIELMTTSIQARWMWTQLETIDPLRVLLVSLLALMIFQLPWRNMGWQQAPWHRVGVAMPALCLAMTASSDVSYLSLASITLVYLRIAQLQKNIRWGYLSLMSGNWLITKLLIAFSIAEPITYACQVGLSLLLISQIDPAFQQGKWRSPRHFLRMISSGLICVTALVWYQEFGITPAIIGLGLIFISFGTQIRAFLYNGTITLMLTGVYQLIILIDTYSFSKWVVGLVAGILLISIAANFEKRRLQIISTLKTWTEELGHWQ